MFIPDKNHSLYLNKFYGHSQNLHVAMHCHCIDVTVTLTVTRNEHTEIIRKGDFFFFSQFAFRLKLMTYISFCDKLHDIL